MMLLSIGKVANIFGVVPQTIRNWSKNGLLSEHRTLGNHRRYSLLEVEKLLGKDIEKKKTVAYSRVSSAEQKGDLKRQTEELKNYCKKEELENIEVIEDIGSGINYKKRGLKKLINWIIEDKVEKIIVSFQDRLLRFGNEIIKQICKLKNIELVTIHCNEQKSFEYQLAEDVLSILTVYSSKVYGRRSHEKRRKQKATC